MSDFLWGTVTQVGPLRVKLDGDTATIPFTPESLVDSRLLTVADRVRVELANNRVLVHGRFGGDGGADVFRRRNLIVNGNFRTNQRGVASGTLITDGAFFFDRWHADLSSGKFRPTWTSTPHGQPLTFGYDSPQTFGLFRQTVERANITPGYHCLSWAGGGAARVYNQGGSAPSFAGSGQVVNLDGLDNVRVEMVGSAGETVSKVQLERGTVATSFEEIPWAEELLLCQRYYYRITGGGAYKTLLSPGFQTDTTHARLMAHLPVPMRAVPTLGYSGIEWSDTQTFGVAASGGIYAVDASSSTRDISLEVGWTGAQGAQFRPGLVRAGGSGGYVDFSAELV